MLILFLALIVLVDWVVAFSFVSTISDEGLRKIYSVLYCSAYNVPVNWFFLTKNEKSKIAFCSPTKHLGVPMNSLKRVRAFQIELEFGNVGFWEEGKTGEKPLGVKERTNNKLNPSYGTRSTVVGEAPPLLSQISLLNMLKDDNSCVYFVLSCFAHYLTCFSSTIQLK